MARRAQHPPPGIQGRTRARAEPLSLHRNGTCALARSAVVARTVAPTRGRVRRSRVRRSRARRSRACRSRTHRSSTAPPHRVATRPRPRLTRSLSLRRCPARLRLNNRLRRRWFKPAVPMGRDSPRRCRRRWRPQVARRRRCPPVLRPAEPSRRPPPPQPGSRRAAAHRRRSASRGAELGAELGRRCHLADASHADAELEAR